MYTTKVKACKSILFTEGTSEVKIKNTSLIQLMNQVSVLIGKEFDKIS